MEPWWEQLVSVLQQLELWIAVAASLVLWWLIGVVFARILFSASGHPLGAARAAAIWATILTPCAAAAFGWYHWEGYVSAAALGVAALVLALLTVVVCNQLEPQLTAE